MSTPDLSRFQDAISSLAQCPCKKSERQHDPNGLLHMKFHFDKPIPPMPKAYPPYDASRVMTGLKFTPESEELLLSRKSRKRARFALPTSFDGITQTSFEFTCHN